MQVTELAPSTQLIVVPTPFPVGPINCYVLEGDPLTLVDTGPKNDVARDALKAGLQSLGYSFADIEQLVLTHGHVDHFGLAAEILDAADCPLWLHPADAAKVTTQDHGVQAFPQFREFMLHCGFTDEVIGYFNGAFKRSGGHYTAVQPTHWLEENQTLRLGDRDWHVYHTPGHAAGEVTIVEEQSRLSLTGDFLLPHISPNPILDIDISTGERFRALPAHVASMQRAMELDLGLLLPGHGEPTTGHQPILRKNLRHHTMRKQVVLNAIREAPRTVRWIHNLLFPNRRISDTFLTISETIGHIDLLVDDGTVELCTEPDVWIVEAINA